MIAADFQLLAAERDQAVAFDRADGDRGETRAADVEQAIGRAALQEDDPREAAGGALRKTDRPAEAAPGAALDGERGCRGRG